MPRIDYEETNKVQSRTNYDYPKLKLKHGERARVLLLEAPVMEYVHTIRAPKIVDGKPVMGTEKRKDGTEYQDYKRDFVSRPLCLGDFNVLSDKGSDPTHCPMCKLAQEHPEWIQPPQPRYAQHIIRYKTKAGGFDLITPFSVETLVWSFTGNVFNQIVDIKTEWGDLRQHDLLLGPCTNEMFQQFDIQVGSRAEWLTTDERKKLTVETFKNNLIPDLSIACGSRKEERWIAEDLQRVRAAWTVVAQAEDKPGVVDSPASAPEVSGALDSLLDDVKAAPAAKTEPPAEEKIPLAKDVSYEETAKDVDDLLALTEEPEKKAAAPAAEEEPKADATDFDDLLADL